MSSKKGQDLSLEITVLSAESLKKPSSSLFSRRLRPYVILSTTETAHHYDQSPIYRTRIDDHGSQYPTWHDTIRLPLDPTILRGDDTSAVHVSVLSKSTLMGSAELGWCKIPAVDVLDGLHPPSMLRRLSYALRTGRDGGRGHGVIHVAVRMVGSLVDQLTSPVVLTSQPVQVSGWCRMAIGIPVAALPEFSYSGVAMGGGENYASRGGFGSRHVPLWQEF